MDEPSQTVLGWADLLACMYQLISITPPLYLIFYSDLHLC